MSELTDDLNSKKVNVFAFDDGTTYPKIVSKKSDGEIGQIKFPAVVEKIKKDIKTDGTSAFNFRKDKLKLRFGDDVYRLGNYAIRQSKERGGWDYEELNNYTLIRLLAGVSLQYPNYSKIEIDTLAVGIDIQSYDEEKSQEKMRDFYKQFLSNNNELIYQIPIDGEYKTRAIQINSIVCLAQGIGAYYDLILNHNGTVRNMELTKKPYGIIDIGGKTVDGAIAEGDEIKTDTITGFDRGTTNVFKEVSKNEFDGLPPLMVEESYREGTDPFFDGKTYASQKIKAKCDEYFKDFASNIYKELRDKWEGFYKLVPAIILCGGGSKFLKPHLEKEFNKDGKDTRITQDYQFSNANGYHKYTVLSKN